VLISARGSLRAEHSTRGIREMRSNAGGADQVVGGTGFILIKFFFAN
jgi:hypothetical protein